MISFLQFLADSLLCFNMELDRERTVVILPQLNRQEKAKIPKKEKGGRFQTIYISKILLSLTLHFITIFQGWIQQKT